MRTYILFLLVLLLVVMLFGRFGTNRPEPTANSTHVGTMITDTNN